MTALFKLDIVSAEASLYTGQARFVMAPLAEGDAGFLPGHSQLLGQLRPGALRIEDEAGAEHMFFVSGGFVEVQPDWIVVLADSSQRAADIDEARAQEAVARAQDALAAKADLVNYAAAEAELAEAVARLQVVRHYVRRQQPDYRPDRSR